MKLQEELLELRQKAFKDLLELQEEDSKVMEMVKA